MKPFDSIKLLKPLISNISLTDPMSIDKEGLNFYIPIYFDPDEYFTGVIVSTNDNEDYIDLYLTYYPADDMIELCISYINYSGYHEGYGDFSARVIIDNETEKYLRELLKQDAAYKWQKYIFYLKNWLEKYSDLIFAGSSPDCYSEWVKNSM